MQASDQANVALIVSLLKVDAWWVANDTEADSPFFVVNDQVVTHIQPICTPVLLLS